MGNDPILTLSQSVVLNLYTMITIVRMAGGIGFEPMHVGIKIRCLNQLGEPPIVIGDL